MKDKKNNKFKFLEHTADVKFQAYGSSLVKAFENSALALIETMAGKLKVKSKIKRTIKVEGRDKESLLQRFLGEFLFLLDAYNFLPSKINKISIFGNELEAEISGDKASNYKFTNDVKAVTYNQMFVKKEKSKFVTQVVLDV